MFDIGFWEIILLCIVTLVVVGPERLPSLVRTAGLWIGKARRVVSEVRAEVERELRVEELKDSINRQGNVEEFKQLADRVKAINSDLRNMESDLKSERPAAERTTAADLPKTPKMSADSSSVSSSEPPAK